MTPCLHAIQFLYIDVSIYACGIYGLPHGFYYYPGSVYRTYRSFPHRLTIPAFNLFGGSHTVYNLFLFEDVQAPIMV